MSAIDSIIRRNSYITNDTQIKDQTWDEFERALSGRNLFLFGVSISIRIFFKKYENRLQITGIVDNDSAKQGFKLKDFIMTDAIAGNIEIGDLSVLDYCVKEETVILISSLKQYQEIAAQLSQLEFKHVYSLFIMEANERLNNGNITRDEFGEIG